MLAFGSYQLGDLYLTGRLGPAAIAAAGATNQTLRQVVFLLLMGLGTAAQMLVARWSARDGAPTAEHIAGQVLWVGAGLWLVTAAVGLGLAEPMVRLVARDPEVVALGADFVRIAFPFVATAVFSQLATAVLLGAGDSYTPMLASFVTTPLALGFEWLFAFGPFGLPALGMSGIALGGGLGGLAGSWLLARALLRGEGRVHLSLAALRPDPAVLRAGAALLVAALAPHGRAHRHHLLLHGAGRAARRRGAGGLHDRAARRDAGVHGGVPGRQRLRHAGRPEPRRGLAAARVARDLGLRRRPRSR